MVAGQSAPVPGPVDDRPGSLDQFDGQPALGLVGRGGQRI